MARSSTMGKEVANLWDCNLVHKILPRHMEIIKMIDHFFNAKLKSLYPGDDKKRSRLSLIYTNAQGK
eukprot:CAMPEP_0116881928 /NCGR_PEP_ID=MMETSP0463-20121206/14016_1 /TAXON_ID=181622 /ORGANISM="Strombidinopsis sp, Strain SopsisLIS2011" /LENGTH=66 /DNA_ID=CAMNT_0004534315 /DNA_START=669 /DNA_END=869 /DNA_ORIENTATION=+